MKRLVIMAILRLCGTALLFTVVAGVVIGVIGYLNKWDTSVAYSNAFFIAGCLMIVAGGSSRLTAGRDWSSYQSVYAESFRDMSSGERANYIIGVSSSYRLVILGLMSGILLILISFVLTKIP
jgi:hypothetical protein